MDTQVIVGFVLTGVFFVIFMVWTWHEVRRVDEIAGPAPDDDQQD